MTKRLILLPVMVVSEMNRRWTAVEVAWAAYRNSSGALKRLQYQRAKDLTDKWLEYCEKVVPMVQDSKGDRPKESI